MGTQSQGRGRHPATPVGPHSPGGTSGWLESPVPEPRGHELFSSVGSAHPRGSGCSFMTLFICPREGPHPVRG